DNYFLNVYGDFIIKFHRQTGDNSEIINNIFCNGDVGLDNAILPMSINYFLANNLIEKNILNGITFSNNAFDLRRDDGTTLSNTEFYDHMENTEPYQLVNQSFDKKLWKIDIPEEYQQLAEENEQDYYSRLRKAFHEKTVDWLIAKRKLLELPVYKQENENNENYHARLVKRFNTKLANWLVENTDNLLLIKDCIKIDKLESETDPDYYNRIKALSSDEAASWLIANKNLLNLVFEDRFIFHKEDMVSLCPEKGDEALRCFEDPITDFTLTSQAIEKGKKQLNRSDMGRRREPLLFNFNNTGAFVNTIAEVPNNTEESNISTSLPLQV
ncbi:MAG: hypothetical protein KC414_11915, partial [Romboutsia sp.]|nr:hypothetical protein [Romboutsia sp.]